jgi:hypothetical protein
VVVVSPSPAALKRITAAVQASGTEHEVRRVAFLSPTEIIAFLDEQGPATQPEASVLGYKVRTKVSASTPGAGGPSQSVARTVVQALRRLRGK